jgi:hypothetical protein
LRTKDLGDDHWPLLAAIVLVSTAGTVIGRLHRRGRCGSRIASPVAVSDCYRASIRKQTHGALLAWNLWEIR